MKRLHFLTACLLACLLSPFLMAQPQERFIKVQVTPEKPGWTYTVNEPVRFRVNITQSGQPIGVTEVRYAVMPERMPAEKSGTLTLKDGAAVVEAGTMKSPGFLRCEVEAMYNGKTYRGIGTAGFEPEKIQPTVNMPADFNTFWDQAKAELAKIPLQQTTTLLPERCTDKVNVYHVSFRNIGNSRMFGILCIPKVPGKYPALLQVPGAGVRAYSGDIGNAEKGFVTLQIGIHGIPVNLPDDAYVALREGALSGYFSYHLNNKDNYYYKRVYLGCVRAIDFLYSLPETDTARIGIHGGSQGGALSIITASLDHRIKYLAAFYPALSDMAGFAYGRAGGWPQFYRNKKVDLQQIKPELETISYYDVVNFARRLKTPGYYSWGFNDETCSPTSMYAAWNQIQAPKQLLLVPETGHWTYPEQNETLVNWLQAQLLQNK